MKKLITASALALLTNLVYAATDQTPDLYQLHCASCHGENRLGGMGPALLPENLKRLRKNKASKVIANGRAATQMPAFADKLGKKDIQSLVDYVYTPLAKIPEWGMSEIKKSHLTHFSAASLSDKPVFEADMMNLFIV
ncbi:MAG: cytochrome c, partial [Gammaproteobacteria bacterium]|nr:cytochrome c [Gammaproteobacteria bacterium]